MESEFNEIFNQIRKELDVLDSNREKILPISREIVRNCSMIIKSVHRNDLSDIEQKLLETKSLIKEIEENARETQENIGKNYLIVAKQEFVEAAILFSYVSKKKIPDKKELEVNSYEYILGLADVVGELKRNILNSIRNNDFKTAEETYDFMDELYQLLFSLDYPSGLLPGFRKKVDVARNLIQRTLEIITTSKNISSLNQNLEKVLKNEEKSNNIK
ncbi:MAG: haloacid dehalogenase [archaeon]|nr:haloacid dehalogenase [archaeon]